MLSEIEQKQSTSDEAKTRVVFVAMIFAALAAILSGVTLYLKLHL